ncbi:MAG: protein kinase [Planctomycetota bacterium]
MKRITLPASSVKSNKKWLLIQELFEKAVELDPKDVSGFLDQACAGDTTLKKEIQDLLDSLDGAEEEFERASLYQFDDQSTAPLAFQVDGYELVSEIHCGGQGTVYRAVQLSTKREVALKFMLAGQLASKSTKLRFEREIELVVGLRHPGIVPVFDSGLANGQYFYAMEYVDGVHLDEYIGNERLSVREILALFVQICEAVKHAQQRGVVHRDLKPSNILVDNRGNPRILDFGLAKSVTGEFESRKTVSMTGQVMGTLSYMSPEQASGATDEIDTSTDVYSLGVVLYEVLTGQLPYQLDLELADNLGTIKSVSPALQPLKERQINGEISTILLKALQKEKSRRYESVGALGEDLARYLRGDPIEAKRDRSLYVLGKVLKRHYRAALVGAAVLMVICASSIASFAMYLRAASARDRADRNALLYESQRDELQLVSDQSLSQLYIAEMNLAGQGLELNGGIGRVKQLTNKWAPIQPNDDQRDWEWYFLQSKCDRESAVLTGLGFVWCLQWHPTKQRVVYGDNDGKVWTWTLGQLPEFVGKAGPQIRAVAWNCDGTRLAAAAPNKGVTVWRTEAYERIIDIPHVTHVLSTAWHPSDPDVLAFADIDGKIELWDLANRKRTKTIDVGFPIESLSWNNRGSKLAVGRYDKRIQVWDAKLGELVLEQKGFRTIAIATEHQPKGTLIATAGEEGIHVLNAKTGGIRWRLPTERECLDVCWSPDGNQLAAVGSDRVLRLLDVERGDQLQRFDGHTGKIWGVDWSPDGTMIATGSEDGSIRIWKPSNQNLDRAMRLDPDYSSAWVRAVDWHPIENALAVVGQPHRAFLVDSKNLKVDVLPEGRTSMAYDVRWSPSGDRMAVAGLDRVVTIRRFPDGEIIQTFHGHDGQADAPPEVGCENIVHSVTWSPDGRYLASCCQNGLTLVWEAVTGEVIAEHQEPWLVASVDWHPDRPLLALACGEDKTAKLWEFETDLPPWTVTRCQGLPTMVRWSPDGMRLAVSSNDGVAKILDQCGQREAYTLSEHTGSVECVAWNPAGTRLATGSNDRTIKLWDTIEGHQVLSFKAHSDGIYTLAWSPDGRQFVSGAYDSMVKIWDARTGYERSNREPSTAPSRIEIDCSEPNIESVDSN